MFVSVSSSIIYYIFVKEFQNESKNPHAKREVKLPTRRAIPLLPNRRTKEGLNKSLHDLSPRVRSILHNKHTHTITHTALNSLLVKQDAHKVFIITKSPKQSSFPASGICLVRLSAILREMPGSGNCLCSHPSSPSPTTAVYSISS